tara:strand:- start:110 stop:595 length:486 start_codon:yes stop_codon:yes gene_type:complete
MPTALVIETGSQSTTANSYITVDGYKTYRDDRYGVGNNPSNDQITQYIYRAMSYFETLNFKGYKATEEQALQFPRSDLLIDGYGKDDDEIPVEVLEAMYELVYAYETDNAPDKAVPRETISESVNGVSVTYKSSSAHQTLTPAVTNALRKLIKPALQIARV